MGLHLPRLLRRHGIVTVDVFEQNIEHANQLYDAAAARYAGDGTKAFCAMFLLAQLVRDGVVRVVVQGRRVTEVEFQIESPCHPRAVR